MSSSPADTESPEVDTAIPASHQPVLAPLDTTSPQAGPHPFFPTATTPYYQPFPSSLALYHPSPSGGFPATPAFPFTDYTSPPPSSFAFAQQAPSASHHSLSQGIHLDESHLPPVDDGGWMPLESSANPQWSLPSAPLEASMSSNPSWSASSVHATWPMTYHQPHSATIHPSLIRHHSSPYTTMMPPASRRRSSTLLTLTSAPSTSSSPHTPSHPYALPDTMQPPSLTRRPSAPVMSTLPLTPSTTKRIHPSPSGALSRMSSTASFGAGSRHPSAGSAMGVAGENKPPRFRPTKEQLEILVTSYNQNKNPDAAARERLAVQLGDGIKPKTLQIWFQNRRSKSRAKEREANLPRPLTVTPPSIRPDGVDVDALRSLVHDEDPDLLLLPLTVLSISSWTRFLTPGLFASPDLGGALRLPSPAASVSAPPSLYLYVQHQAQVFRIAIPIHPGAMSQLQTAENQLVSTSSIAVRFELARGLCRFQSWSADGAGWAEIGDFTGGEATLGGSVELTGERDVLLSAFSRVQDRLLPPPLPSSGPRPSFEAPPTGGQPQPQAYHYYHTATSSAPSTAGASVQTWTLPLHALPAQSHLPSTVTSTPTSDIPSSSSSSGTGPNPLLAPAPVPLHHPHPQPYPHHSDFQYQQSQSQHAVPPSSAFPTLTGVSGTGTSHQHTRQRSFSLPLPSLPSYAQPNYFEHLETCSPGVFLPPPSSASASASSTGTGGEGGWSAGLPGSGMTMDILTPKTGALTGVGASTAFQSSPKGIDIDGDGNAQQPLHEQGAEGMDIS